MHPLYIFARYEGRGHGSGRVDTGERYNHTLSVLVKGFQRLTSGSRVRQDPVPLVTNVEVAARAEGGTLYTYI